MASSLHTINTDEANAESDLAGWDIDYPLCPWVPTHYPPAASFASQSSSSPYLQYSAIQLSPELGPGTLMTPPSTQLDPTSISWLDSSSPSQCSTSNTSGTGDFPWMNLMGSPELDASGSASTTVQPHSTDIRTCKHHFRTQEKTSHDKSQLPSTELKHYGRFKCHWEGCAYPGTFSRETCLWRHIKSTHVSPDEFKCPDSQCNKTFGRKDRFQSHMRLAHTSHGKGDFCSSCRS